MIKKPYEQKQSMLFGTFVTSLANSWDQFYKENKEAKYPNENIIRFVAKNFYSAKNRKNVKILELGCGSGNNIWFLAKEGFDAYGIDISETAITKCKERLLKENLSANLQVGNITKINYPNNYFDAVIDGAAIESNTIDDIKGIINEAHRVLKPKGKFFSLMLSTNCYYYKKYKKIEKNTFISVKETKRKGTLYFFKKKEINILLDNAGFVNINIEYTQRTLNNSRDISRYWLAGAEKPGK